MHPEYIPVGVSLFDEIVRLRTRLAFAESMLERATQAERERCAQIVFDSKPGDTHGDVMKRILNPSSEEGGGEVGNERS